MTNIENAQIKELTSKIESQSIRLEAQILRQEQNNVHVQEMGTTLKEIQHALLGSPITDDGGMVKRLKLLEETVEVFKVIKSKWLGIIWFILAISGTFALVYYATAIYKNIFGR